MMQLHKTDNVIGKKITSGNKVLIEQKNKHLKHLNVFKEIEKKMCVLYLPTHTKGGINQMV